MEMEFLPIVYIKARTLPEIETGFVLGCGQVFGAEHLQPQTACMTAYMGNHGFLDISAHDPTAEYKINNPALRAVTFQADYAGQAKVTKAVRNTDGPEMPALTAGPVQ